MTDVVDASHLRALAAAVVADDPKHGPPWHGDERDVFAPDDPPEEYVRGYPSTNRIAECTTAALAHFIAALDPASVVGLLDQIEMARRAALIEARDATCTFCSHGDEPTMGLHYPKFGDGILQIACNASAIRALLEAP